MFVCHGFVTPKDKMSDLGFLRFSAFSDKIHVFCIAYLDVVFELIHSRVL